MEPLSARTLPDQVRAGAGHHGGREAIVDGAVRLTCAGPAERFARFAGTLAASGVGKGDRVALWAPNSWRWIVAALGVVTAGGVLVPLNTRFKGPEAGYILARSGARMLLVDDGFLGNRYVESLATENLPDLSDIVAFDEWDAFVARTGDVTADVQPDDLSDLFFTSGTTGRPKGAMLTHRQTTEVYVAWSELAGLRAGDRYLLVNRPVSAEDLATYCKERLANSKLPRSYVFLDALPRNASGKVLKTTLRKDA